MQSHNSRHFAFTLVELMVSMAVLVIIVTIMVSATDQAGQLARRTSGKIEQFEQARHGFEKMTRRLSEATLNTYWDYFDANGYPRNGDPSSPGYFKSFVPTTYGRQSELRFRSGATRGLLLNAVGSSSPAYRPTHGIFFQAPFGEVDDRPPVSTVTTSTKDNEVLEEALNTWGFFLEVASDKEFIPPFLANIQTPRIRSRLLELRESTETLNVYKEAAKKQVAKSQLAPDYSAAAVKWFSDPLLRVSSTGSPRPVRVLAENIVALVLLPRLSQEDELPRIQQNKALLCPTYEYDSTVTNPNDPDINPKNQLPPVVQVVMVAVDETSAARLASKNAGQADLGVHTDDLFATAAKLEDDPGTPAPGDGDLNTLEQRLLGMHATYRIFSSNVLIRGAKWSKAQAP